MTTAIEIPFRIGDVLWQASNGSNNVKVPCPVCNGDLAVTVILGDGERVGVPCEACGKGFNGPRGYIEEWQHDPAVSKFVIASIQSFHADRWCVNSETGGWGYFNELFPSEDEAMARAVKNCAEQHERNMQSRQRHRKNVKEAAWSIQYHRKQIADLERQIAWHQGRVSAKKAPVGSPEDAT